MQPTRSRLAAAGLISLFFVALGAALGTSALRAPFEPGGANGALRPLVELGQGVVHLFGELAALALAAMLAVVGVVGLLASARAAWRLRRGV